MLNQNLVDLGIRNESEFQGFGITADRIMNRVADQAVWEEAARDYLFLLL
jgi:hypothetical protein